MYRWSILRVLIPIAVTSSAAFLLALANGCSHPNGPVSADGLAFAGDAACERCHAKEFSAHKATRHAGTMHMATRAGLGTMAPEPGDVPESPFEVEEASGKYSLQLKSAPNKSQSMEYSLGSGKTGLTFIQIEGDAVRQARMS